MHLLQITRISFLVFPNFFFSLMTTILITVNKTSNLVTIFLHFCRLKNVISTDLLVPISRVRIPEDMEVLVYLYPAVRSTDVYQSLVEVIFHFSFNTGSKPQVLYYIYTVELGYNVIKGT
jgi:hypothetical protein